MIECYTETTPNPASLKFVFSKVILPQNIADFKSKEVAEGNPLPWQLFQKSFVERVFISNNFVTITKGEAYDWYEIIPELKEFLKTYIIAEKPILGVDYFKNEPEQNAEKGSIEAQIMELLDKYVKPAIEMDGGHIAFKQFKDGIVTLEMQGACSGCPSSQMTLKGGIEGLLKRMLPEVKEVVALAEGEFA